MSNINCSKCGNSVHENFIEYSLIGNPLCEACKDENSDYFIFNNLTNKEKNTLLENISEYDISGVLIGEGEGREVYDIDVLQDNSLIIKKRKYKTVDPGLNYQNYVENFLYTRLKNKFSVIPKIYLPYDYGNKISNDRVFMEKCHILDESFFTGIDIRNEEDFNKVIKNNNIDFNSFRQEIEIAIDNNLTYEGFKLSYIQNKEDLITIFTYFILFNFIDEIDELISQGKEELEPLLLKVKDEYLYKFYPEVFEVMNIEYNFPTYDLSLGIQWGISNDNYFRLIDFGGGVISEKLKNKYEEFYN